MIASIFFGMYNLLKRFGELLHHTSSLHVFTTRLHHTSSPHVFTTRDCERQDSARLISLQDSAWLIKLNGGLIKLNVGSIKLIGPAAH